MIEYTNKKHIFLRSQSLINIEFLLNLPADVCFNSLGYFYLTLIHAFNILIQHYSYIRVHSNEPLSTLFK